jgi:dihydroorotate dehydrogenase (fumarate)
VDRYPERWIEADLAATSGIHRAADAIKCDGPCGCHDALPASTASRHDQIRVTERELAKWMETHGCNSVEELKGSMNQKNCPDPAAFERAQCVRGLSTSWRANA